MGTPKAFISYSRDDEPHKEWVAKLATQLRNDGIETILDQWHAVPGDQLPEFMEREIRENDYVLIICTPNYRVKSDQREGGVGYEGDIMTAEVHTKRNHRKFIPIIARGGWPEVAPSWLKGKYYIDLSTKSAWSSNYPDLKATMLGTRKSAPPVGDGARPPRLNLESSLNPNSAPTGERSSNKKHTEEVISEDARMLLKSASAERDGAIMRKTSFRRHCLKVGEHEYGGLYGPDSARWEQALEELVSFRLVSASANEGDVYLLTYKGREKANKS